jgi:hypothetical protein
VDWRSHAACRQQAGAFPQQCAFRKIVAADLSGGRGDDLLLAAVLDNERRAPRRFLIRSRDACVRTRAQQVSQIFTSSNPLTSWLRQLDALRRAA